MQSIVCCPDNYMTHGRSLEPRRPRRRGIRRGRWWHRHHGDADGRRGGRDRRRGEPIQGEPRRAHRAARAQGLSVVPVAADASTDDGIATVIDQVRGTDGELYGLVNVAGGAEPSTWMPSTRVTRDDWRDAVHREPRDGVLHEPGGRGRDQAQQEPRVDRLDLLDQRHEHARRSTSPTARPRPRWWR